MNTSISAAEYSWYKYTGQRITKVYYKRIEKGEEHTYELPYGEGNIFGVRVLSNGGAFLVDMEDQSVKYKISEQDLQKLLKKSVKYTGKVSAPNAPIRNVEVDKDKNNPDAYKWHRYDGTRGTSVYSASGKKVGIIRTNEMFGLFTLDPKKGGYFLADGGVKDSGFGTKPIKIDAQDMSDLIAKSSPLKKKPLAVVKPDETKPVPVPTVAPKNGVPSVVDLKQLNVKVADVNAALKDLAKRKITSLDDYKRVKSQMISIRDTDVEAIKDFMHEISVTKEMAKIILDLIKANWNSSVAIISAKKRNVDQEKVEEEAPAAGPLVIGVQDKQTVSEKLQGFNRALKDKAAELSIAVNVEEVQSLIADLKKIQSDAKADLSKLLKNDKQKLVKYLTSLHKTFSESLELMEAKIKLLQTPQEVEENWPEAEEPTEDFSPVEEDQTESEPEPELEDDEEEDKKEPSEQYDEIEFEEDSENDEEDRPAKQEDLDELEDLMFGEQKPVAIDETDESEDDSDYTSGFDFDDFGFDGTLGIEQEKDDE